nr:integrase, catalytic region, zinc finger, CCHC-type, peptidase aspartic, catalytic [Tanacetum cinerariifolium]
YENAKLRAQLFDKVSDQKDTACGTSMNTKFEKQSIRGKPPKVGEAHALSKPVTSNSILTPQGSKVVKYVKVIALGMFRINPFKSSREEKHVHNKGKSKRVDNTKTRRPQPRRNTKNDRVPSTSKSSYSKNKENVKYKVVCAMCKQCLISANHDVCFLNYVNGMTSHGKKQKAYVLIQENQKKQKPEVKKPKKVGSIEILASLKPSKPRSFLRWSPTGRLFDLKGKIIASSKSESQSDCSKGDNACKLVAPSNSESHIDCSNGDNACCSKHMTGNLELLINFVWKFLGTVRFGNDHVTAILGFGDLLWGNILITRVYFVEGLGHNLFSIGQFCDSDLEVAFRRNACFVRNLEGVDLLK